VSSGIGVGWKLLVLRESADDIEDREREEVQSCMCVRVQLWSEDDVAASSSSSNCFSRLLFLVVASAEEVSPRGGEGGLNGSPCIRERPKAKIRERERERERSGWRCWLARGWLQNSTDGWLRCAQI
jgi:hypothetical protein